MKDNEVWDIKIPKDGDIESKLQAIERQLAGQVKEFIFVLDADTGEELYRDKGTFGGIFDTIALQNVLNSRRVIIITHNHPKGSLDFSLTDLNLFFSNDNVIELRATTGLETAILPKTNKQKYNEYKALQKHKISMKLKLKYTKSISNEDYLVWANEILPIELKNELSLLINYINL
jgi:hypothetical protein